MGPARWPERPTRTAHRTPVPRPLRGHGHHSTMEPDREETAAARPQEAGQEPLWGGSPLAEPPRAGLPWGLLRLRGSGFPEEEQSWRLRTTDGGLVSSAQSNLPGPSQTPQCHDRPHPGGTAETRPPEQCRGPPFLRAAPPPPLSRPGREKAPRSEAVARLGPEDGTRNAIARTFRYPYRSVRLTWRLEAGGVSGHGGRREWVRPGSGVWNVFQDGCRGRFPACSKVAQRSRSWLLHVPSVGMLSCSLPPESYTLLCVPVSCFPFL